jgi:hypothetical protein
MSEIFTITLRAEPGINGVRALRGLLKSALRAHGLRALSCVEQTHPAVARRRRPDAPQARQQGDLHMDMSKYAGSGFLSLDDLADGPIRCEIAAVEIGNYNKPVLTFSNGLRFSLNVTNTQALLKTWGAESDDWIGARLELSAGTTRYQGEDRPSVVVRALTREPEGPGPKVNPPRADMNDDIPF